MGLTVSADENLSGPQFYHGSRHDLNDVQELTTAGARAARASRGGKAKPSLYFSDDPALAAGYGNVWKVQPTGDYTRRRMAREKQETGFPVAYEYTTKAPLKVTGPASDEEVTAARRARKAAYLKSPHGQAWAKEMREKHGIDPEAGL